MDCRLTYYTEVKRTPMLKDRVLGIYVSTNWNLTNERFRWLYCNSKYWIEWSPEMIMVRSWASCSKYCTHKTLIFHLQICGWWPFSRSHKVIRRKTNYHL
jgi:hypothetical protein